MGRHEGSAYLLALRCIFEFELALSPISQRAAQTHHTHVMLIEQLPVTRVEWDVFQHNAILLEHIPMLLLVKGSEQEPPCLFRRAGHLAVAPKENAGSPLVQGSHE